MIGRCPLRAWGAGGRGAGRHGGRRGVGSEALAAAPRLAAGPRRAALLDLVARLLREKGKGSVAS